MPGGLKKWAERGIRRRNPKGKCAFKLYMLSAIRYVARLIPILLMASCSIDGDRHHESDTGHDMPVWESARLPIELSIDSSMKHSIREEWNASFGRLEIEIAPDLEIFVVQADYPTSAKLEDPSLGVFEIEFLNKSDSLLVYGSRIPGSDIEYWHFFRTFELNGKRYYAENNPLIEYSKHDVEVMSRIFADIRPSNSSLAGNQ